MEANTAVAEAEVQQAGEQPTSLSFLQLHDAFKRMVAVGVDVVDEQVRNPTDLLGSLAGHAQAVVNLHARRF